MALATSFLRTSFGFNSVPRQVAAYGRDSHPAQETQSLRARCPASGTPTPRPPHRLQHRSHLSKAIKCYGWLDARWHPGGEAGGGEGGGGRQAARKDQPPPSQTKKRPSKESCATSLALSPYAKVRARCAAVHRREKRVRENGQVGGSHGRWKGPCLTKPRPRYYHWSCAPTRGMLDSAMKP